MESEHAAINPTPLSADKVIPLMPGADFDIVLYGLTCILEGGIPTFLRTSSESRAGALG